MYASREMKERGMIAIVTLKGVGVSGRVRYAMAGICEETHENL